jgi:hypothetical protein
MVQGFRPGAVTEKLLKFGGFPKDIFEGIYVSEAAAEAD